MTHSTLIGIDVGGTNLKIALLDAACRIKDKLILPTRRYRLKSDLIQAVVDSTQLMLARHSLRKRDCLGIGVGLPGPIDFQKGIVNFFPNIPGWIRVPLRSILQKKLRVAVLIDNDANLMALAEQRHGAGAGFQNVVCVTLGTGVGGGIILGGELYRGGSYAAGEIGHVPLNESGPKCNCSGMACLEAYIGNRKILAQAKKVFGPKMTLERLSLKAQDGDRRACAIWSSAGKHLGVALSGIVNILNPDCIVIGGGVAEAGAVLFESVKETIAQRAMAVSASHVRVRKAALGSDAGMIGAALLVKENQ